VIAIRDGRLQVSKNVVVFRETRGSVEGGRDMRQAVSISAALLVAMLAMVPEVATGAERTVLGEYFNATW
jgi:hypothetical protein